MLTKDRLPRDRWRLPIQVEDKLKLRIGQFIPMYSRARLRIYFRPAIRSCLYVIATRSGEKACREVEL